MSWMRFLRRKRWDDERRRELESHLAEETSDNLGRGMAPDEARRAAARKLGNPTRVREEIYRMNTISPVEKFLQDARYALRMFRRNPGFTVAAIATLALGIGANTAIFSVVDGVLLRSLPYPQPNRLVSTTMVYPEGGFVAMRSRLRSMDVAMYAEGAEFNLTGFGEPIRLYGCSVSAEFFSLLGAHPELGTTFLPGQDQPGNDNFVILSDGLWKRQFSSDPNVIGRSIALEGVSHQVVAVMPPGFQYPSAKDQLWVPLHLDPGDTAPYWGGPYWPVIGRLRPGFSIEGARAELHEFLPQMISLFPFKMPDALWRNASLIPFYQDLTGDVRAKLLILLGAITLVLLIACANVANLLLSRAAGRQREIAVRAALGAPRTRLLRQLLTESVLLALCGAGAGIALAHPALNWLKSILPADTPRLETVGIDARVLIFAAAVAVVTGIIFGLAPALHMCEVDLTHSLRNGRQSFTASTNSRIRGALAVTEIALAIVLVIAAGLMTKSLWKLAHVYPGFHSESIVTARITPDESFCLNFDRCQAFYDGLLNRVRALPGIQDAALVNVLPLDGRTDAIPIDIEGYKRPPDHPTLMFWKNISTADYLKVMQIPLLQGRSFIPGDSAPNAAPVVLVSATTARRYWPGENPIGKHLKHPWIKEWRTVVGVVADVREDQLANQLPSWLVGEVYIPYGPTAYVDQGHPPTEMTLVVRISAEQSNLAGALRDVVSDLQPDVPVTEIKTLRAVVSDSVSAPRSTTSLFALFAALALILGAIGIYGVVSYSVAQRTSEIGLRMALGAQRKDVLGLVLGEGIKLVFGGVGIGVLSAFAITRLLVSLLYGVNSCDPWIFAGVSILLALVAVAACYVPARRAMQVDPISALRYE